MDRSFFFFLHVCIETPLQSVFILLFFTEVTFFCHSAPPTFEHVKPLLIPNFMRQLLSQFETELFLSNFFIVQRRMISHEEKY